MSTTSNTNSEAAAASRPQQRRGSDVVLEKGVRAGAKRFRQCFPGVNSKKKRGWKAQPDVGYTLCNDLRKRHNESIARDERVANALSHRATANAREMATDAGAAAASPAAAPAPAIYLYKPAEILAADAAGYPSSQLPTQLITVFSNEAAELFIRQGHRKFDVHTTYQTLAQVPASPVVPPTTEASHPVYLLPPPEGEVEALPPTMPKLYEPKDGDPPRSAADTVVESFEIKVIDEAANCVWHPIRMWPTKAKERKNLGYDHAAGLNNRLKAYYAIKCGQYTEDELKKESFASLMAMGVKAKAGKTDTYFDLAKSICNINN